MTPEIWVWSEYYCPWSYITAVRLAKIAEEFDGRVRLVERPFPLEVYGGGPPNRVVLEQEWWLAALQEPAALFRPYQNPEWPTTTLPAFEAVWAARQFADSAARKLDLRIRRAFFAESANLSDRQIYPRLALEIGLDMPAFNRLFDSDEPRKAVLEEGRLGHEKYRVQGTPTVMMSDGKVLNMPFVEPDMQDDRIVSVAPLPCYGEECYQIIRRMFERVA